MKKAVFVLLCALCILSVQAQRGYRSYFGQESTVWVVMSWGDDYHQPDETEYLVQGDTVVDGVVYKKVYRAGRYWMGDYLDITDYELFCGAREDTLTGRLWFDDILFESRESYLVADLTLEVGDSFNQWPVSDVYVDSLGRKVILMRLNEWSEEENYIIEGIGTDWPSDYVFGGSYSRLACVFHDGVRVHSHFSDLFLNVDEENCSGVNEGVEDVRLPQVRLYPNPTEGQVVVDAAEDVDAIFVRDAIGRNVEGWRLAAKDGRKLTLDVSRLRRGVYLFVIQSAQGCAKARFVRR